MLFIAISNIVLLCPILSSFLLIRLTFFFQQMRFKLDPKDDATKQACTHVFQSALRQYRYHLTKYHFEGKANSELAQTSPVENISDEDWRGLVKHWSNRKYQVHYIYMWSDHMFKSYLRMCHTNLSSCRWTVQRTRPTVRKWNSNKRQDLVAILHTARLL